MPPGAIADRAEPSPCPVARLALEVRDIVLPGTVELSRHQNDRLQSALERASFEVAVSPLGALFQIHALAEALTDAVENDWSGRDLSSIPPIRRAMRLAYALQSFFVRTHGLIPDDAGGHWLMNSARSPFSGAEMQAAGPTE